MAYGADDYDPVDYSDEPEFTGHYHKDERGILQKCYHHCRHRWYIWLPAVFFFQIMLFPLEHQIAEWLWQQPGFEIVSDYMGWGDEE